MDDDYEEDFGALAFIEKRKDFDGKDDEDFSEAKKFSYPSFVDRYFKKYYKLDVKIPFNDHLVLLVNLVLCFFFKFLLTLFIYSIQIVFVFVQLLVLIQY
jgi:hypothetical protein